MLQENYTSQIPDYLVFPKLAFFMDNDNYIFIIQPLVSAILPSLILFIS